MRDYWEKKPLVLRRHADYYRDALCDGEVSCHVSRSLFAATTTHANQIVLLRTTATRKHKHTHTHTTQLFSFEQVRAAIRRGDVRYGERLNVVQFDPRLQVLFRYI